MKIKKVTSWITMAVLLIMLGASSLTVAKASNAWKGFDLSTESYYGDDYDVSEFQAKDSTDSVRVRVDYADGVLDYRVVGAMEEFTDDYDDCSNGYVYRISSEGEYYLYSWVKEWGYSYAGLRVDSTTDSFTNHMGAFMAY